MEARWEGCPRWEVTDGQRRPRSVRGPTQGHPARSARAGMKTASCTLAPAHHALRGKGARSSERSNPSPSWGGLPTALWTFPLGDSVPEIYFQVGFQVLLLYTRV